VAANPIKVQNNDLISTITGWQRRMLMGRATTDQDVNSAFRRQTEKNIFRGLKSTN